MRCMGYPEKLIRIMESLYRDTFSAMRIGADLSEWFKTIMCFKDAYYLHYY